MSETTVTCPYCDKDFEVSTDDGAHYNDEESEEDNCPNCDKRIMIYSSCSWYREASKADCLNEISDHDWSLWNKHHPDEKLKNWYATRNCLVCGRHEHKWMPITDDDNEQQQLEMYKRLREELK